MIPVDIDNFIFVGINYYDKKMIMIKGYFNKIPREIVNCYFLKYLNLNNKEIVDISALSNCSSLRWLSLNNNHIKDISVLSNCSSLIFLDIGNNKSCNFHKFNNNISVFY